MKINLYTADQSRELDRTVIEKYGISGKVLMGRAGKLAFKHIFEFFDEVSNIVVLCGSGNNGGDGYVVALCALKAGFGVQVLYSEPPKTKDAKLMYRRYLKQGGVAKAYNARYGKMPARAELIVDALLGTGTQNAPRGLVEKMIRAANRSGLNIVSLDIPSGLNSDAGCAYNPCISALITVTFMTRKVGCYTVDGNDRCGAVIYESLGVPRDAFSQVSAIAHFIEPVKIIPRRYNTYKRDYGELAILGGSKGMLGAVLLAGRAGIRAGCGLVTVVSKPRHADILALHCPEVMSLDFGRKQKVQQLFDRSDALVVGPGMRDGAWGHRVFAAIRDFEGPVVVDAGALRVLAKPLYRQRRDNWVLTPHPGEAAALLDCTTEDIQKNRMGSAAEIVRIYGGVCVLKGIGTIVSSLEYPEAQICELGNPGMATAGMGDVLSGIIGALLAAGDYGLTEAAAAGVWLHSNAADFAADKKSDTGMIASDVIECLPRVFKALNN